MRVCKLLPSACAHLGQGRHHSLCHERSSGSGLKSFPETTTNIQYSSHGPPRAAAREGSRPLEVAGGLGHGLRSLLWPSRRGMGTGRPPWAPGRRRGLTEAPAPLEQEAGTCPAAGCPFLLETPSERWTEQIPLVLYGEYSQPWQAMAHAQCTARRSYMGFFCRHR